MAIFLWLFVCFTGVSFGFFVGAWWASRPRDDAENSTSVEPLPRFVMVAPNVVQMVRHVRPEPSWGELIGSGNPEAHDYGAVYREMVSNAPASVPKDAA